MDGWPMPNELPRDATIKSVLGSLGKREDYILCVLKHMRLCEAKHGPAYVRIGVTGTGQYPCHKIVYDHASGAEVLFEAYDEDRPFTDVEVGTRDWSSARMSHDQVKDLLGHVRGYAPGRRSFS